MRLGRRAGTIPIYRGSILKFRPSAHLPSPLIDLSVIDLFVILYEHGILKVRTQKVGQWYPLGQV